MLSLIGFSDFLNSSSYFYWLLCSLVSCDIFLISTVFIFPPCLLLIHPLLFQETWLPLYLWVWGTKIWLLSHMWPCTSRAWLWVLWYLFHSLFVVIFSSQIWDITNVVRQDRSAICLDFNFFFRLDIDTKLIIAKKQTLMIRFLTWPSVITRWVFAHPIFLALLLSLFLLVID